MFRPDAAALPPQRKGRHLRQRTAQPRFVHFWKSCRVTTSLFPSCFKPSVVTLRQPDYSTSGGFNYSRNVFIEQNVCAFSPFVNINCCKVTECSRSDTLTIHSQAAVTLAWQCGLFLCADITSWQVHAEQRQTIFFPLWWTYQFVHFFMLLLYNPQLRVCVKRSAECCHCDFLTWQIVCLDQCMVVVIYTAGSIMVDNHWGERPARVIYSCRSLHMSWFQTFWATAHTVSPVGSATQILIPIKWNKMIFQWGNHFFFLRTTESPVLCNTGDTPFPRMCISTHLNLFAL